MNQPGRIYFLDNLRACVVVLVVILHGAMVYMFPPLPWWYVVDSQNSLFFTTLVVLIDVPIMLILFFIAGFFALPSLAKRGSAKFMKGKFIRVGAPWLVGALLLAPPITYLIYYSRDVPVSFLQFLTSDFLTSLYQQSVYWYLGVLFFFLIILALVYKISPRLRATKRQVSNPTWKLFILFWGVMSLGMFLMNQFFPIGTWYTQAYIFVFQPLRVPLYVGYFVLGIYAHLKGWFSAEGYRPVLAPWLVLWLVSGLFYFQIKMFVLPNGPEPAIVYQLANAMLFNLFCLSSLMAGVAFTQDRVNIRNMYWSKLSPNSYGIYYVHPLILYPLAYLFVSVSLPLFIKAPLVILLAILLSWAVSAFFLTKVPLLRRVFA